MDIKILVVIYNTKLSDSATLLSLANQKITHKINISLVIYDNSARSNFEKVFIEKLTQHFDLVYKHTPQNLSLREIYNGEIKEMNSDDILVILDDDTSLPDNYLDMVAQSIIENPSISLFVPKIFVHGSLYSPHKSFVFLNRKIKKITNGAIYTRNMSAINSGMVIRGAFFKSSGFLYPNFVDFYGTDKVFFDAYASNQRYFYVMNICVDHDVSNHPSNRDINNYASVINKVNVFWLKYLDKKRLLLNAYKLFMLFYALKLSLKNKKIIFLKNAFNLGFK